MSIEIENALPSAQLTPGVDAPPAAIAPEPPRRRGLRGVGRDALVYGLGTILRRAATLILLPLYTRLLTPADYGLLQMLDMTLEVVSIVISAGTTAGVMRFYYKTDDAERRRSVLGSACVLLLGLNAIGALLIASFAGVIHAQVLDGAGARYFIYIAAANFVLNELPTLPSIYMQLEGRAAMFSMASLARLLIQLSLNVFFLLVLRLGPVGVLLSTMIANVAVGSVTLGWMIRRIGFAVRREQLKELRIFAIPYQLSTVATFMLQYGDRFFLARHGGLAVVGLYGFAYQFGFLFDQIGTSPIMRAWEPRRFASAREPLAVREREDNASFLTLSLVGVTIALGMALFIRPVLAIVASPAYGGAADLVPLVVAAFLVQAWTGVVHFGIDAAECPRLGTVAMWVSAATALALYALLIPRWGAYGAAIATLVSFLVRFALMYRFAARVWPLHYRWGAHLRLAAYALVLILVARTFAGASWLVQSAAGTSLFGVYALLAWTTVLTEAHVAFVKRHARGLVRRVGLVGARA